MKGLELSDNELIYFRAAYREALMRKAEEAYKINAIILLGSGWTLESVSEA